MPFNIEKPTKQYYFNKIHSQKWVSNIDAAAIKAPLVFLGLPPLLPSLDENHMGRMKSAGCGDRSVRWSGRPNGPI